MVIEQSFEILASVGIAFTILGAIFLLRSIVGMGSKEIAEMSGTYLGSNRHLASSYVELKCDTFVGFLLTLFGGILTLISSAIKIKILINIKNISAFIVCFILIFILLHYLSKFWQKIVNRKVRAINFAFHVDSYIRNNPKSFNASKLITDAKNSKLDHYIDERLDDHQNLANILEVAGAGPGAKWILDQNRDD